MANREGPHIREGARPGTDRPAPPRRASRRLVLGLLLLLALLAVGVAASASASVLFVDNSVPNNPPTSWDHIQWAVDNASGGDTVYVYAGTYVEAIDVGTAINLVGEDRDTTKITTPIFSIAAAISVSSDNVNIASFTLYNSNYGIDIKNHDNLAVDDVVFNANTRGINLLLADSVTVGGSVFTNHTGSSQYAVYSSRALSLRVHNSTFDADYYSVFLSQNVGARVEDNTITAGRYGIYTSSSRASELFRNEVHNMSASSFGIRLTSEVLGVLVGNSVHDSPYYGLYISSAISLTMSGNDLYACTFDIYLAPVHDATGLYTGHTISASNLVEGKPVRYVKNATSVSIPAGAGWIGAWNVTNLVIGVQNISNTYYGIWLDYVTNVEIAGLNFSSSETYTSYALFGYYVAGLRMGGLNTTGRSYGAYLYYSSDVWIENSHIVGPPALSRSSVTAWYFYQADSAVVANSHVEHASGLYVISSTGVRAEGNTFNDSGRPFYSSSSRFGILRSNVITNSTGPMTIWGSSVEHYFWDIPTNNTLDGRAFRSYVNASGNLPANSLSWVMVANSTNAYLSGYAANNDTDSGGIVAYSTNVNFNTATFYQSLNGFIITDSFKVNISDSHTNGSDYAFQIYTSSEVFLEGGSWTNSTYDGVYMDTVYTLRVANISFTGYQYTSEAFLEGYQGGNITLEDIESVNSWAFVYLDTVTGFNVNRVNITSPGPTPATLGYGFYMYSITTANITNSFIADYRTFIRLQAYCTGFYISGNRAVNLTEYGLYSTATTTSSVNIVDNVLEGTGGIAGVYVDQMGFPFYATYLNISGFGEGIHAQDPSSVFFVTYYIEGNQINNTTVGIYVSGLVWSQVMWNTVSDTLDQGIWVRACSSPMIVHNNTVNNAGSTAVWADTDTAIKFADNHVEGGDIGVWLDGGGGLTVYNNDVNGSLDTAMYVSNNHVNTDLIDNTLTSSPTGLYMNRVEYLTLRGNSMSGNTYNFRIEISNTVDYYHDVDTSNEVDGKPVEYHVNATSLFLGSGTGMVVLVNTSSSVVTGATMAHNYAGITLYETSGISVIGTTLSESYYGVWAQWSYDWSVSGLATNACRYGMYGYIGSNLTLSGSQFEDTLSFGAYITSYSQSEISNSTFNNTGSRAIYLISSTSNLIADNVITNSSYLALDSWYSQYNTYSGNTLYDNWGSWSIGGNLLRHYTIYQPVNNTIDGKPVFYATNATSVTVPPGVGMVILANVSGALVADLALDSLGEGVIAFDSEFLTIRNITFGSGAYGLHLNLVRDSLVQDIRVNATDCCVSTLMFLESGTERLTVENSTMARGSTFAQVYYASNMLFRNLTLGQFPNYTVSSMMYANGLVDNITIDGVNFSNAWQGVYTYGYGASEKVSNVTVTNSSFGQYTQYPLYVASQYSADILFYHNNFNMSYAQFGYQTVYDTYDVSTWNLAYPVGGNFWSNWTSPDNYQGAGQNLSGPDGFVDVPLVRTAYAQDAYPLTDSWPPRIRLVSPGNGSAIVPGTTLDFYVPPLFESAWNKVGVNSTVVFTAPYNISTSGWAEGDHSVLVWGNDSGTGAADAQVFVFSIDTTPPFIDYDSPTPPGPFVVGTQLNFTISDAHLAPNATWDAGWGQQPFATPWNISTAGWADGGYNITVRAWDTAGLGSQSTLFYWVDADPPVITLNDPANNSVIAAGGVVDLTISDTSFQNASWSIGLGWNALTAPFDVPTTGWSDGAITLVVHAEDTFGRTTVRSYGFVMDSTPPSISLNAPANNSYFKPGTTVDLGVSDTHLVNASWSTGGSWNALTSPFDISTAGWSDGAVTLTVVAFDQAGNGAVETYDFTVDSVRPTITLDSPANNSMVQAGTTLAFSISDANPFTATWNNGGCCNLSLSAPYDISTTGWSDATYTVLIVATDSAGNARSTTFVFTIDSTPPTVTLNAPSNDSVVPAGTVLDLSVSDPHLTTVTWDNGSGAVSLSSPYDVATDGWPDGPTDVVVQASDTAGNVRTTSFHFTFDSTPPTVTLNSPANGSAVQSGTTVDFSVSDTNLASANWSTGGAATAFTSPYDVSTSGFAEGSYDFVVQALDQAGNVRVLVVTIDIDDSPPSVLLNQPANGSTFGAGTLIDFGIGDAHGFSAAWDNGSGTYSLSSPFDVDTTGWVDGSYTVWVNATDVAGNSVSVSFGFVIDNTFPAVVLQAPSNNSVVLPGTTLDLDVVDNDLNSVTWDNGSGALTLNAPYDISTTGWSDGHVNITVVAADNSSHTVEVVFHFILDSVAPTITLVGPANNSIIKGGTPVNLSVFDLNIGSVTWNNGSGPVALSSPYIVPTGGWPDGPVNITVTATDLAGNSLVRVYSYTMDSTAPAITLNTPANNSVIAAGTTLDLSISDAHTFAASWDNGSGGVALFSPYDISTAGWADGTFDVAVQAVDTAGNLLSRSFRFTIDSLAPSVSLNGPSNGSVIAPGTTLDFGVSDAHLSLVTWSDGSTTASMVSPFDVSTSGWSDGSVVVWVNAADQAGNAASRWYSFVIDGTAPSIALNGPANGSVIAPGQSVDLSISDTNGFTATWNNGSGALALASPFDVPTSGWPEGGTDLVITATDEAGNTALEVFRFTFDGTPPTISLASPANGSLIQPGTVLDLTVTDANGIGSATWDDGSGAVAFGSPYNISTAGWSDGVYTVTVTATDVAGNVRVRSYDFELDSTGPTITLNAPANGSVLGPGAIIDLDVSDANGLSGVTRDNGSGAVALASPFDINTTGWPDGSTTVVITATDSVGNVRVESFDFTIDRTAPTITLDAPTNGSVITPGTAIELSVTDPHLLNALWNNGSGAQSLASPYDIPTAGWADGSYTLNISATDSAGNTRFALFQFFVDGTPPSISLVSPANNSHIAAGTVLDFLLADANPGSATWNNGTGPVALMSPHNVSTTGWLDGAVTVTVNATDLAGNTAWASFSFTMDSTPPSLVLIAPSNNSILSGGTDIDLDASDLNLATVTWNNGSGPNLLDTPFDVPTDGWADGDRNITVVATDLAGNMVTGVYHFTFDSTLPSVVLNAPTNGSIIPAGTPINLSVSDTHLDTVVWNNGSGNNALTAPWDIATTGWTDGIYNVTVTAIDLAGNARVFVAQFIFDTAPPVIALSSPANNSYITPGDLLDLQVTDLTSVTVTYDIGGGPIAVASPYDIDTSGWSDGSVNVTVTATDAVGNTANRLLHFTVDGTLPSITLITPGNNSVVTPGTSVNFLITDANLNTATWDNGGGPSAFVTQWNISTSGWSDGSYDIDVQATDLAGNVRTRLVHITIDSISPTLALNTPTNNSYFPAGTFINLTVIDANLYQVTWDDGSGSQGFVTPWNISTAGWSEGPVDVTVVAQDAAGNTRSRTFHFVVDSTLPSLSLNTPSNNSFIPAGTVLNFTITDANLDTAVWDRGSGDQGFGTAWNISTTGWADGPWDVVVTVTDLAGNQRVRSYHFTVDSTLPSVVLDAPNANSFIRAGTLLNFTVSDTNLATVVWNNGGGNQSWSAPWQISTTGWADGSVTVTVYASDLAGNQRQASFQFTIDSTLPSIVLSPPSTNNSYFPAGTVISFNIVEANLNTATWDRGLGAQAFAAQWTISTGTWADGVYDVVVAVTDLAGNAATRSFHFTVDSTPPAVGNPLWNGTFVDPGTVLNATVTDVNLAWFSWSNGAGQTGNVSAGLIPISSAFWADGAYTITLTAQDLAGNRATRTAQVTVDSVVPVISGVTPADGSFVTPGTTIQFNAADTNLLSVQWQRGSGAVLPANGSGPYTIDTSGWTDGNWSVRLIATDRAGHQTVVAIQLVTDQTPPQLPSLPDLNVQEDVEQTLDASGTTDGPNPLDDSAFEWNISDRLSAILTGRVVLHTWTDPGNYTVTLTVTDRAGNVASHLIAVTVQDTTLPTADAGADQTVDEDTQVTLNGTGSFDNDAIAAFLWTQTAGPGVSFDGASPTPAFTPDTPGVYSFQLVVTDNSGLTGFDNVTIRVLDITPPTIALPSYPVVNEGVTVGFNATGTTDNDPASAGNLTFLWTFTYGEPQFLSGVAANYTFALPGTYTVTLTVTDPSGNQVSRAFDLRVNDVPTLSSLPPGTFTLPGTYQGVLAIVDSDAGDTHNVTVITPAAMVVANVGGNPALEWTPEDIGFYVVEVSISDGWSTANYSFNITVGRASTGNHPPVFTKSPPREAREGSLYTYLPTAVDEDGDSLLFGLDSGPAGMTIAPSTGELRWSHGYTQSSGYRIDEVRMWVWDGAEYTYQNFSIRFIPGGNTAPTFTAAAVSSAQVEAGKSVDIPYFSYLSDADDPPANLTLLVSTGSPGVASASIVGAGSGLAVRIVGVTEGTAFLTLTLRDPSGAEATKSIQVTVVPAGTPGTGGGGESNDFLVPLIGLAAVAGAGAVGFLVLRRRKGQKEPEVAQAAAAPAEEVQMAEAATVAAPAAAVTAAAAAAAPAAEDKGSTYTIEGLFVIYKDGRLLYSKTDMGQQKFEDPELVSSMFTAVQSFIQDSFAAEGELNRMGYGENKIIIERGRHIFIAAIVYGDPDQEFNDKVRETIEGIELSYAGIVEEWDGMTSAFSDMEAKIEPIVALTAGVSRREVQYATTKQEVRMLSELEFFQGFVRLKVGIKNNTPMVITKVTVDIEYNEDVLRLGRVEPAAYRTAGAKVLLGVLNPGEKSSVAYYFDPQICTESQIDGVCRYRDASGVLHTVSMKTRKAEVVCPLFFTKEHANTAMLKRLVESELTEKDAKVFEVQKMPAYIKWKDVFDLVKSVVNAHDVQMVREFTRFNPFQGEAWFYGETKVKNYKIVIRAAVIEEGNTIEFFAASTNMKAITGLLAEFNHTLNSTVIEKYSDLKLQLLFDNEAKAEVDRKSLMSQMSSDELEGGEIEQDEAGAPPPPGDDPPQ